MSALPDSICGRRLVALSVAMLFASEGGLRSEGEGFTPHTQVVVECQVVCLPQKLALRLIPALSDDSKIDAAWTKVEGMVAGGEAVLVANFFGRSSERERLVAVTAEECRYPTEFSHTLPPLGTPKEKAAEALKTWPVIGICPSGFEVRDLGWILELESAVSPNAEWVHIQGRMHGPRLLQFSKEVAGTLSSGQELSVLQPQFAVIDEIFDTQVHAGQRFLLSVHRLSGVEDMMALGVMRVRTSRVGGAP